MDAERLEFREDMTVPIILRRCRCPCALIATPEDRNFGGRAEGNGASLSTRNLLETIERCAELGRKPPIGEPAFSPWTKLDRFYAARKRMLPMSALGQKLPRRGRRAISALPPRAAADVVGWRGSLGPIGDKVRRRKKLRLIRSRCQREPEGSARRRYRANVQLSG